MSFFQKISYRITGVLGRDRKGNPLRVGDFVEPASGVLTAEQLRCTMTVVGYCPEKGPKAIELLSPDGVRGVASSTQALVKVQDDEDSTGSWEDIGISTGWTPKEVKQGREVSA